MKIIACYKLIPEEQDLAVNADGSLNFSRSEPKISPFDLNAIEAAVELNAVIGDGKVTALSVGGKTLENPKSRKDVLSRGPDELLLVIDEQFNNALPHETSAILAAAAKKTGFDLIICGEGSGDLYAQQVGTLLGELLDIPAISGVSKIVAATNGVLTVERGLEEETEVLNIALPALISVSSDINDPKIPSMKAIISAARKPIAVLRGGDIDIGDIPALAQTIAVNAPKQKERLNIIIEGDGDDQIAAFSDYLRKVIY